MSNYNISKFRISIINLINITRTVVIRKTVHHMSYLFFVCFLIVLAAFLLYLSWLEVSDNPARKTKYDLVAVRKEGLGWVNIDSQAPNKVVKEWLETQGFDAIHPEFSYGKSRIDFAMERAGQLYLLEVKGCTLEVNGIGYFPDAPTERGVKHLQELTQAQQAGVRCGVAFVIQMEGITEVRPNVDTHPAFGEALAQAKAAGVKVLFLLCQVGRDSLDIVDQREG